MKWDQVIELNAAIAATIETLKLKFATQIYIRRVNASHCLYSIVLSGVQSVSVVSTPTLPPSTTCENLPTSKGVTTSAQDNEVTERLRNLSGDMHE